MRMALKGFCFQNQPPSEVQGEEATATSQHLTLAAELGDSIYTVLLS